MNLHGRCWYQELEVSPTYYVHPEFGYFCLARAARRELRIVLASILFGIVIGAAIVTVGAGHAVELDGGSSNADLKPSSSDTFLPDHGVPSSHFQNVDNAETGTAEAIKPYPMRMVRVRSSKGASPLAGIPLGRSGPPEPTLIPFDDRRDSEGFRSMR
jgi:hypothetical protein